MPMAAGRYVFISNSKSYFSTFQTSRLCFNIKNCFSKRHNSFFVSFRSCMRSPPKKFSDFLVLNTSALLFDPQNIVMKKKKCGWKYMPKRNHLWLDLKMYKIITCIITCLKTRQQASVHITSATHPKKLKLCSCTK